MSDERKTLKIQEPACFDWAIKLTEEVRSGFEGLQKDVAAVKADVALLADSHKSLSERMSRQERRQDEFEHWRARSSERARAEEATRSKVDLEHQAQLVFLTEKMQEATKAQTGVLIAELTKAAATPKGQKVINALVVFVVTLLTVATGWLAAHGGGK